MALKYKHTPPWYRTLYGDRLFDEREHTWHGADFGDLDLVGQQRTTVGVPVQTTERPEVVVLCGSTRFKEDFERETLRLALEGKIVLTVSCFGHMGDLPPEACEDGHPTKTALDELHKRKIDMADRVLVINPGGYIGTSTRSEIEYAELFEKPIDYMEKV
jgi:hypothetical protein